MASTQNSFALGLEDIDDDADIFELLRKKEEEQLSRKNKKNQAKATQCSAVEKTKSEDHEEGQRIGGVLFKPDTIPPSSTSSKQKDDKAEDLDQPLQHIDDRSPRKDRAHSGRGDHPSKHKHDRHSGSDKTGLKSVEKRDGSGAYNWGNEIQAQFDAEADLAEEKVEGAEKEVDEVENLVVEKEEGAEDSVETTEGRKGAEPGEEEEDQPEEEAPQMTLEEWRASQAASRNKPKFNVRQANEGSVDTDLLKEGVKLKKKESVRTENRTDSEIHEVKNKAKDKDALNKLNIKVGFYSKERTRGEERPRDRGGFRGRGGFPRAEDRPPPRHENRPPRHEQKGTTPYEGEKPRGGFGDQPSRRFEDEPPKSGRGRGGFGGQEGGMPRRGGFGERGGFGGRGGTSGRQWSGGRDGFGGRGGFGGRNEFGGNRFQQKSGPSFGDKDFPTLGA